MPENRTASRLFLPLAIACSSCAATAAQAQSANPANPSPTTALPEVVVTAQRVAQPLTDVLADVAYIDRAQVRRSGAVTVADLLQRQPGLEMSRSGGPGNPTSVFTRGAGSEFTAVYIDGVRVDNQAGSGGAPWEAIALDQIDHIEILRGPAAAVYGSDAVAGVIQIFTRKGEGPFTPYVGVGAGTRHTGQVKAGFSGKTGSVDYSLGAERDTSRGYPIMPTIEPRPQGYRQNAANGRLGWQISPTQRLDLTGTSTHMDAQFVSPFPPIDNDASNRLNTLGATWTSNWTRAYTTRLMVGQSNQGYAQVPSVYMSKTQLRNYSFQNEWRAGKQLITATLERREDHLVSDPIDRGRFQNGVALGWGLHSGPHTLQLNARYDHDSEFGGSPTGSASYGYSFAPGWRATASVGTAFRVPTLYQRFSQYGDPSLTPQKSRNVELGVRWARKGDSASATVYRNDIRDLIDFAAGGACGQFFGCFQNAGRARLQGVTLAATHRFGAVNVGGSFDWMQPTDRTTGHLLARRAQRMLKLNADTSVAAWKLGAELQLFSHRWDDAANTVRLNGYGLVNLYASTTVARDWDFLVRLDNLTNRSYQLAQGYATPGRTIFASLRWTPR
ncbi:MAG: TonB-dependent receptor [Burkholderiaceae bacterium]|nr:MAG: TonB-dependent receptor [Burkholderiaceae bacterium]